MSSPNPKLCSVCESIGAQRVYEAFGLVFAGVEAFQADDMEVLENLFVVAEPADFHAALTLIASLLSSMARLGLDTDRWVAESRELINAQITGQLSGQAPDSTDPGGPGGT